MSPMPRAVLGPLALVVLTAMTVSAAEHDEKPPPGAILRLGSSQFCIPGQPRDIAFSPDGKTLAGCGGDDSVRLWDVETGKERGVFRSRPWGVVRIAFSADGKWLAGGSRTFGVVWDATTLKEVLRFRIGNCQALAFSPDGGLLAVGEDDGSTILVDTFNGKEITRFKGHDKWVWTLAFSRDGRTLVTGSFDGTARLWDVEKRTSRGVIQTRTNGFSAVGFLPEGNTVLLGGQDGKVSFLDLDKRKEVRAVAAAKGSFTSLAVQGDGTVLATASADEKMVRLWDVATGKELRRIENLPRPVYHLAFSADGRTLATASFHAGRIQLWDAATGKELHANDGHHGLVSSAHLSPDGKIAVTGSYDRTVRVWDLATGKVRHNFDLSEAGYLTTALSGDGKIAAGTVQGKVHLYDLESGKRVREIAVPPGDVTALTFTPDGKTLLTGCGRNDIRTWDVATGKETGTLTSHEHAVFDLAVSADGKTLASGSQGTFLRLWDLADRKEVRQCQVHGSVHAAVLSADGKSVACGSGRHVRVFDVASGAEKHVLIGHQATVLGVAFSADGKLLLSSAADRTLVVWDLASERPVARPLTGDDVWFCLTLSADGKRLLTGGWHSTAVLWDMAALSKPAGQAKPLAAEELDRLWSDICSDEMAAAHVAIWELSRQPKVEAFLNERLTGKRLDGLEKRIRKLAADLDADEFAVREKATRNLRTLGEAAAPILRETLDGSPSLEVRRRIEAILEDLKPQAEGPSPAELLRASRTILVLERVGSKEAREVLRSLAFATTPSQITVEAKEALDRLEKRATCLE